MYAKFGKRIQLESYSKTHHEFFQTQSEFPRNLFKHVLFFCFTPETYSSILIFCSIRHISVIFSVITERFYSRILDLPQYRIFIFYIVFSLQQQIGKKLERKSKNRFKLYTSFSSRMFESMSCLLFQQFFSNIERYDSIPYLIF